MIKLNRYLRDLGIDEQHYPFPEYKDKYDSRYIPDDTGMSEAETWDMRFVLAMIIYSYLMKFKETKRMGYPANLTPEKWEEILDDMIKGFRSIVKGEDSKRAYKRQRKALTLFKNWFWDLWD